jgi:fructoselysine 6-kinase
VNIVCVGDCGVDRYEPDGTDRAGGISLNVALRAREAFDPGARIHLVAPLGRDREAGTVLARLQGIDIEQHFTLLDGSTPVQHIRIEADGERRFTGYAEGVLRNYRVGPEGARLIGRADLVVTPVFEQNRGMFESVMALETTGWRAVDFADFADHPDFDLLLRYAPRIDIAFFGLRDTQIDLIDALQRLAAETGLLVVVTLGAAGSLAWFRAEEYSRKAAAVPTVVDTTGAGDAFAAAFLAAWLRQQDVDIALRAGTELAAIAVQQEGAN